MYGSCPGRRFPDGNCSEWELFGVGIVHVGIVQDRNCPPMWDFFPRMVVGHVAIVRKRNDPHVSITCTCSMSFQQDQDVTDGRDGTGNDAIQLQPQEMNIKLRPKGKGVKFDATFRAAKNFPVDLYFLFDVSATMASTLKQLSELAIQMGTCLRMTWRSLGYGVFQDKVILPFTSTHPVRLKNPFPGGTNNYAPAIAFDHMLNLTQDLGEFRSAVNESLNKITGNLDRPEGGFDAIMQAIVCKKMGWRDNSRQIIIFGSDLAGLITPNDEQCHLTEKGENEMSEKQDYPSVGQISAALDRTKKYIIFAVKESIENEYKHINKRVSRSTHSALTKENNIVDIVQTKYRVTITPECEQKEGTSCTGLKIGQEVRFKVQVRAERCPADPADRVQTVTIAPSDFRLDTLVIKVELLCECDCQLDDASSMVPSMDCTEGNGTIECGVCRCFPGRAGSVCECGLQDEDISLANSDSCKEGGNSSSTPECSGTGVCECGMCHCQAGYTGKYCQCNNQICGRANGLVCAGNGECDCESCRCFANYTGHACQCVTSDDVCIAQKVTEPVSVVKRDASVPVTKDTAASSAIVAEARDEVTHEMCAKCVVMPNLDTCKDNDTITTCQKLVRPVKNSDREQYKTERRAKVSDDCYVVYSQLQDDPSGNSSTDSCYGQIIYVEDTEDCGESPDLLIVVLGIVGGVVAVGLLLLILWKILTMLFDKMEYAHFERELNTHKWAKQVNPLYKGASTTYYNPIVDKSASRADDM
ncbi:hypothetical protein BaRGS_00034433 [Batillaria attramentaria]|uniref:Integrin beta n=1 Tax=Batillaria attramentaria TaxID=370345 RepID=A0ABD0JHC2_9CAEN